MGGILHSHTLYGKYILQAVENLVCSLIKPYHGIQLLKSFVQSLKKKVLVTCKLDHSFT